jgi:hypothetical protein
MYMCARDLSPTCEIMLQLDIVYMMYKLKRISMFILNKVETSHILISIRLYFILTILITEDGPQPSILSDCNFSSSAGEGSGTQGL